VRLEHVGELFATRRAAANAEAGLDNQVMSDAVCLNTATATVEHIAASSAADLFHAQAGKAGQVQTGLRYAAAMKRVSDAAHSPRRTDHDASTNAESCTEQRRLDVERHPDDVAVWFHPCASISASAAPAVCTTTPHGGVLKSSANPVILPMGLAPLSSDSVHVSKTPLPGLTAACLIHSSGTRGTDTAAQTKPDVPSETISSSTGRECDYKELVSMGFSAHRVALAMEQCAGQPTRALDLLLQTPEQAGCRPALQFLGFEQCGEATSHRTMPGGLLTADATGAMSSHKGAGKPCRSPVLASRFGTPASDEQPCGSFQGLCAAGPFLGDGIAVSMQAQVARAGYTSCPRCEQLIPNKFLADHFEYACKFRQNTMQPPEWKTTSAATKGLSTTISLDATRAIPVLTQSERHAGNTSPADPKVSPPAVGVMQQLMESRQAELVRPPADWHHSRDAVANTDLVYQPSDTFGLAGYPDGQRSQATVFQRVPAEAEDAVVVVGPEFTAHCQLHQSDLSDSPGSQSLCETFADSQAVRTSRSGAASMSLPCPTLGDATFEAALLFDRSDASDIAFHIHKSQVYNRGQWRGGESTTLQLLHSETFCVPETPDASQCVAEAGTLSNPNPPAVEYDHRSVREEIQVS
jgi:hypothetical protein